MWRSEDVLSGDHTIVSADFPDSWAFDGIDTFSATFSADQVVSAAAWGSPP